MINNLNIISTAKDENNSIPIVNISKRVKFEEYFNTSADNICNTMNSQTPPLSNINSIKNANFTVGMLNDNVSSKLTIDKIKPLAKKIKISDIRNNLNKINSFRQDESNENISEMYLPRNTLNPIKHINILSQSLSQNEFKTLLKEKGIFIDNINILFNQ